MSFLTKTWQTLGYPSVMPDMRCLKAGPHVYWSRFCQGSFIWTAICHSKQDNTGGLRQTGQSCVNSCLQSSIFLLCTVCRKPTARPESMNSEGRFQDRLFSNEIWRGFLDKSFFFFCLIGTQGNTKEEILIVFSLLFLDALGHTVWCIVGLSQDYLRYTLS